MKKITRVARIELNTLFYSPIAWLTIIIFLGLSGMDWAETLEDWLRPQQNGFYQMSPNWSLTDIIYNLHGVQHHVYLFIPLITMGLISKEVSSGTIKLLYSSPLSVWDVLLGKFLAMMFFNLVMVCALAVYLALAAWTINSPDIGLLACRLLGFYLLLGAYSAIGLFMSSLTSYQVVAAIGTVAVFASLNMIQNIGQKIDFIREVTYYLSLPGKTFNFYDGLIVSGDVMYFVVIMAMFLFFSYFKLQGNRKAPSWTRQVLLYSGTLCIGVVVICLASLPMLRIVADTTASKSKTLTPTTQGLLAATKDAPLEVNFFINVLDDTYRWADPVDRHSMEQWRWHWSWYQRFRPDMKFSYIYYYDSVPKSPRVYAGNPGKTLKEIAQQFCKARKMSFDQVRSPEEMRKIANLKAELGQFCVQLKYKDRVSYLRMYDDQDVFPTEAEISTALKLLVQPNPPRYVFLTGEYERDLYKPDPAALGFMSAVTNRSSLINQGVMLDTVNLHFQDMPTNTDGLVIVDPRTALDPVVKAKVQRYIDEGGNLLIAGESKKTDVVNALISQFGVQLHGGSLVQNYKGNARHHDDFPANIITSNLTPEALTLHRVVNTPLLDSSVIALVDATGLTIQPAGGYEVRPIAVTDARWTWQRNTMPVLDSAEVRYSAADGDERKSFPTIVKVTRKRGNKEQRIIISSDADWLSNTNTGGIWFPANHQLKIAAFSWLNYNEFPPDVVRDKMKDQHILHLRTSDMKTVRLVVIGILPGLLLAVGAVILIRRKRK